MVDPILLGSWLRRILSAALRLVVSSFYTVKVGVSDRELRSDTAVKMWVEVGKR